MLLLFNKLSLKDFTFHSENLSRLLSYDFKYYPVVANAKFVTIAIIISYFWNSRKAKTL